jgi:Flp pilus assembly protein TadD
MSKPMLVTWPCVLLLLDYWPLKRFPISDFRFPISRKLLLEKIPFFALAAMASTVAFGLQHQSGVLKTVADFPPGARVGNIAIAYCRYLGKMFWPTGLAVFYPHPGYWPLGQVLLAIGFLCSISIFFWVLGGRYPFLRMGWLWFLGTLVPVIGVVQVGTQSMADRYSYIPSLGVLILIVWSAGELARYRYLLKITSVVVSSAAIVFCLVATRQQLGYWKDSETLFRHTLAVTKNNYFAHKALGTVLLGEGQTDEAIRQFQEAIRLNAADAEAHNNLGIILLNQGHVEAAMLQFQEAVDFKPDNAGAHYNLAGILFGKGQMDAAINHYQAAIRLQPDNAAARNNLGIALASKNQIAEAIGQFQESLRLQPNDASVQSNLARALQLKTNLNAPPDGSAKP